MKLVATELQVQRAVIGHLQWRKAENCFAFCVPNGGYRRPTEAALLKSLGVIGGVPDIMLVHQARAFGMELKRERTGRLSPAQIASTRTPIRSRRRRDERSHRLHRRARRDRRRDVWRHGLAFPDNLLAQWFVISVGVYLVGRGWFWLCRNHPFAAIALLGFLRGLLGGRRW